jgi:hypothetical protein
MKKRSTDAIPTSDLPDLQRRRISKLIAAVTVLGTGLGVKMSEVFAAETRPTADELKWNKQKAQQPGTRQFKVESPARPGVVQDKHVPPAEYGKITRPGATQAKPVPATRPGAIQDKHVPPAEYGKITRQPGAGMLKGEVKPSADMLKEEIMLKGETQGIEPGNDKPAAHYGKVESRPGAGMLKGEVKPSADMLKGEAQGAEPLDKPADGFVPK